MILQMVPANSDRLSAQIAELDGRIEEAVRSLRFVGRQVQESGPRQGQSLAGRHAGPCCISPTPSQTFRGARYRRLARWRGKQKAIVATGNSLLTIVYHLLLDAYARFCELGPGYYESRINKHCRARDPASQPEALTGQHIVIRDGKASLPTPLLNAKTTSAQHDPASAGYLRHTRSLSYFRSSGSSC